MLKLRSIGWTPEKTTITYPDGKYIFTVRGMGGTGIFTRAAEFEAIHVDPGLSDEEISERLEYAKLAISRMWLEGNHVEDDSYLEFISTGIICKKLDGPDGDHISDPECREAYIDEINEAFELVEKLHSMRTDENKEVIDLAIKLGRLHVVASVRDVETEAKNGHVQRLNALKLNLSLHPPEITEKRLIDMRKLWGEFRSQLPDYSDHQIDVLVAKKVDPRCDKMTVYRARKNNFKKK